MVTTSKKGSMPTGNIPYLWKGSTEACTPSMHSGNLLFLVFFLLYCFSFLGRRCVERNICSQREEAINGAANTRLHIVPGYILVVPCCDGFSILRKACQMSKGSVVPTA